MHHDRPSNWAQPATPVVQLENYYRVSPTLYRARQPSGLTLGALASDLSAVPFRSVVNLRAKHSDALLLHAPSGIRLIEIPIDTWALTNAQIMRFLKVATDPANQPILVHCKHGSDRTGTMVAAYRIVVQGWSKADAIAEMEHGGYGFHPIWQNLIKRIEHLPVEQMRRELGIAGFSKVS